MPCRAEEAVEILRAMRAHRLAVAAQLREMEPKALEKDDPFPLIVLRGGIEFNEWFADWCERMEHQLLDSAAREKEQLMFDALARLADGNARRIGLLAIAFFLLAGALGGSVANRLDPYGADDPATETVKAREQLQDAGLRVPAVIAVVEDAPVAKRLQPGPGRGARARACAAAPTSRRSPATTTPAPPSSSPTTATPPTSPSP